MQRKWSESVHQENTINNLLIVDLPCKIKLYYECNMQFQKVQTKETQHTCLIKIHINVL